MKKVRLDGKVYNVPDDATMEEIDAFIKQQKPDITEQRRQLSKAEFESNQPESTFASRAREAAIGILEPFDARNIPSMVKTVVEKATPSSLLINMSRGMSARDAFKADVEERLGITKELVAAPVRPLVNVATGVLESDYDKAAYGAGGVLSQTVPAAHSLVKGVRQARGSNVETARELYRSGLKAPTTMKANKVSGIVETGLKEGIPISDKGLEKLTGLIDEYNDKISDAVKTSQAEVSKYKVASRLKDTADEFAEQVTPQDDLAAIGETGNKFLAGQPAKIPAAQAQAMKVGTYKQLRKKYGQLGSATVEAEKALARGLKEELADAIPELKELNAAEAKLLEFEPTLSRAVNRAANANKGRLGPMIAGGVTKAVTGSGALGVAAGVVKAVLDDPEFASKLAIAIYKAQKKNPRKFGTPNWANAAARIGQLSTALKATADSTAKGEQEGAETP